MTEEETIAQDSSPVADDVTDNGSDNIEIDVVDETLSETVDADDDQKQFDPKKDRVDFDTPEQQKKFDYLYKQVKESDKRNSMLTEFLEEQQKQIDEIRQEKNIAAESDAEKAIMDRIRHARDEGDDESYDSAFAELVSFRSEKQANKIFEERVKEYEQKEVAQETEKAKYVASLMDEKDEQGNFKRPWLQETHPDYTQTIEKLSGIAIKYMNDPNVLEKSLAELDEYKFQQGGQVMSEPTKPQTRAPNPMQGSNLTNQNPKGKIKMTRQEMEIAKKLGVDPKKYAAQRDKRMGGSN